MKKLTEMTMAEMRTHCVMETRGTATVVPKKWKDKPTALNWIAKNLGKKAKPVKEKKASKKITNSAGKVRRAAMVERLKKEKCTATELAAIFGVQYKAVLDDVHAIRHNRGEANLLKEGEVLAGVRVGRNKVFFICTAAKLEKLSEQVQIEINEEK